MSSEYKSVCDRCGRKTYHENERPCTASVPVRCKSCGGQTGKFKRCPGTLRKIDNSRLNPAFHEYYKNNVRIEVAFRDKDGVEYWRKRGTIGKTTGWKPVYLLMLTRRSIGSPYTISMHDTVEKIIG